MGAVYSAMPGAGAPGGGQAPPGMGVALASAPPPPPIAAAPPPPPPPLPQAPFPTSGEDSLPTAPPTGADRWETPVTEEFGEDVRALVGWAMVSYRSADHPLFIPGANYDRLVAKLANSVVEKEQTQWKDRQMPILRDKLDERLGRYVQSQVQHMHSQHKAAQKGGGK